MVEENITWRNAIDGSTSGPIAKAWNVRGWPTVYVIDEKGVIVEKTLGFQKEKIEAAIEKALQNVGK